MLEVDFGNVNQFRLLFDKVKFPNTGETQSYSIKDPYVRNLTAMADVTHSPPTTPQPPILRM